MRIYRSARATTKCKIEFQLTRKLIELISENKILIFSYLFSPSEAEETHGWRKSEWPCALEFFFFLPFFSLKTEKVSFIILLFFFFDLIISPLRKLCKSLYIIITQTFKNLGLYFALHEWYVMILRRLYLIFYFFIWLLKFFFKWPAVKTDQILFSARAALAEASEKESPCLLT